MKRHLTAVAAGLALALVSAGNALADGSSPVPLPAPGTQSNDSSQGQVQIVPIAPQLNVQDVNVLTGDVEQGDAANANTGQTAQQENTAVGQSQAGSQSNESSQGQVQVVPVAPQANVQNVNVATFGDVEQGDAANANTGQAAQQENTGAASHHGSSSKSGGESHAGAQENTSHQGQVQVIPVAPQANVQNVNVATFGDVEQGDAANANTGQTAQQENTAKGAAGTSPAKHGCGGCTPSKHSGGQSNRGFQEQVQVVPIAPQANLQNVNVLTFGDVEQGDAANANTGQTTQQENTRVSPHDKQEPKRCYDACKPQYGPEPRPCGSYDACEPQPKPRPCDSQAKHGSYGEHGSYDRCEPRPEPKPRPCDSQAKHGSYGEHGSYDRCEPRPEPKPRPKPKPCGSYGKHRSHPPEHGGGQRNESRQGQVQILPIAPQLNVQNVNLLTFGDVEQGDAANANTGQVAQQSNRLLPARPSRDGYRTVA
jgi:hypothetical protein